MERKKDKGLKYHMTPSSTSYFGQPDDVDALLNQFGTYEVQRTADADNAFPMIAQGFPRGAPAPEAKKRGNG